MTPSNEIHQVCAECGISANVLTCLKRYGNRPHKLCFTFSTSSAGECDYCRRTEDADGEPLSVTSVRDFFYPNFDLLTKAIHHAKKENNK